MKPITEIEYNGSVYVTEYLKKQLMQWGDDASNMPSVRAEILHARHLMEFHLLKQAVYELIKENKKLRAQL